MHGHGYSKSWKRLWISIVTTSIGTYTWYLRVFRTSDWTIICSFYPTNYRIQNGASSWSIRKSKSYRKNKSNQQDSTQNVELNLNRVFSSGFQLLCYQNISTTSSVKACCIVVNLAESTFIIYQLPITIFIDYIILFYCWSMVIPSMVAVPIATRYGASFHGFLALF